MSILSDLNELYLNWNRRNRDYKKDGIIGTDIIDKILSDMNEIRGRQNSQKVNTRINKLRYRNGINFNQ